MQGATPCKWHADPPLRCESVVLQDPSQQCQLQKADGVAFCSYHRTYPNLGRRLLDYIKQHRNGRPDLETFLSTMYPGVEAPLPFEVGEFTGIWTNYVENFIAAKTVDGGVDGGADGGADVVLDARVEGLKSTKGAPSQKSGDRKSPGGGSKYPPPP